jgi:Tol biopolymer transport system component
VAFDCVRDGHWHIYVVPSDGGAARQLTHGDNTDVRPSWSPDGQWLFFGADRGGSWAIWKVSVSGGAPQRVTNEGTESFVSPDGKWVYYTRQNGVGLWRMPLGGGEAEKVLDQPRQSLWGMNRQGVYYLDVGQDRATSWYGINISSAVSAPVVMFYSFETQKTTRVMNLPANISVYSAGGRAFAVSPDGKTILLTLVENEQGDLYLVENFR